MNSRIPQPTTSSLPNYGSKQRLAVPDVSGLATPKPRASRGRALRKLDRTQGTKDRIDMHMADGWDLARIEKSFANEKQSLSSIMRQEIWLATNCQNLAESLHKEHSIMCDRSWDPADYGHVNIGITEDTAVEYMRQQMTTRIKNVLDKMALPTTLRLANNINTFAKWEYLKPEIIPLRQWAVRNRLGRRVICTEMSRRYGCNFGYTTLSTKLQTWLGVDSQSSFAPGPSSQTTPWTGIETPQSSATMGGTPANFNDDDTNTSFDSMIVTDRPLPLKFPNRTPSLNHDVPLSVTMDDGVSESGSHASHGSKAESIVSIMSGVIDELLDSGFPNWMPSSLDYNERLLSQNPNDNFQEQFDGLQNPHYQSVDQQPLTGTSVRHHNVDNDLSSDYYNGSRPIRSQPIDDLYLIDQPVANAKLSSTHKAIDFTTNHLPVDFERKETHRQQVDFGPDSGIADMELTTNDDHNTPNGDERDRISLLSRPTPITGADDLIEFVQPRSSLERHTQRRPFAKKSVENLHSLGIIQDIASHNLHRLAGDIYEQNYDEAMKSLNDAFLFFDLQADTFDHDLNTPGHIAISKPLNAGTAEVATLHWISTWLDHSGVQIDTPNRDGETLLHLAAKNGFHLVLYELLQRSANTKSRNNTGLDPYEACLAAGRRFGQSSLYYARLFDCAKILKVAMLSSPV